MRPPNLSAKTVTTTAILQVRVAKEDLLLEKTGWTKGIKSTSRIKSMKLRAGFVSCIL